MKYIYYYIWRGLTFLHPWISKIILPFLKILLGMGIGTVKDIKEWKKHYNKAMIGFPGGINDWFAYGILLAFIYSVFLILLFYFSEYTMVILNSDIIFMGSMVGIAIFTYYWIYFRKIDWLKDRINKVSKKYYT